MNINKDFMIPDDVSRRHFLKSGTVLGTGALLGGMNLLGCAFRAPASARGEFRAKPMDVVRVGFVGIGNMATVHIKNMLEMEGMEFRAFCDIVPEKAERAQQWAVEAGKPKPTLYTRGDWDFVRMCQEEELDLVYTATPWEWHVPVCVAAMKNGKHAATEVPAAITMEDCWKLVETAEKYQKHCVIMENCCYDRVELMALNMVRKGLFGEMIYAECGYMHDTRYNKFESDGTVSWWGKHFQKRNGNLYPTHGLGPVSQCLNINRGDRFDHLVSMGSNSRGLHLEAVEKFGPEHPASKERFKNGDVNMSILKTVNGNMILVGYNVDNPRPYSRMFMVQGTKGLLRKYPEEKSYIDQRSPKKHKWEELSHYTEEFEHPLWKALGEKGSKRGHGGMDYIEDYRLIHCLRNGLPMDMDVYDAATWSVVIALTEKSVATNSRPVDFPDFTRGQWKTRVPIPIVTA